jgi:uncharacterized protein (DUF697 family)
MSSSVAPPFSIPADTPPPSGAPTSGGTGTPHSGTAAQANSTSALVPAATEREQHGQRLIQRYIMLGAAAGAVPVPLADQVLVGGLLGKMTYDLGQLYGIPVPKYRTKGLIFAILGGAHSLWISRYLIGYGTLFIPGLNVYGNFVVKPAISAAIVYAIGQLFLGQFSRGIRIEAIKLADARREFARGFEEGKAAMLHNLQNGSAAATEAVTSVAAPTVAQTAVAPTPVAAAPFAATSDATPDAPSDATPDATIPVTAASPMDPDLTLAAETTRSDMEPPDITTSATPPKTTVDPIR